MVGWGGFVYGAFVYLLLWVVLFDLLGGYAIVFGCWVLVFSLWVGWWIGVGWVLSWGGLDFWFVLMVFGFTLRFSLLGGFGTI